MNGNTLSVAKRVFRSRRSKGRVGEEGVGAVHGLDEVVVEDQCNLAKS